MNPTLATWLNRIGLFIDFLAFWFAAPELLGEGRLKSLESRVERQLERGINTKSWTWIGALLMSTMLALAIIADFTQAMALTTLPFWGEALLLAISIALAILLMSLGSSYLQKPLLRLMERLLKSLRDDENIRQRSLLLGAAFFVLGTALQIAATF